MNDKRYFIIYVRGNDETILSEFDNKEEAQAEFEKIKKTTKKRSGPFVLLSAHMLPDGTLDIFNRDTISIYCPEVEAFLKSL